jgi:hypothetical protein
MKDGPAETPADVQIWPCSTHRAVFSHVVVSSDCAVAHAQAAWKTNFQIVTGKECFK